MFTLGRSFPRFLLALLCSGAALLARGAGDVRFSATLTPELRECAGFSRLSADNIAVIDGLVRQDEAASKFKDNDVDHTRFSARRTSREREIAGLGQLTAVEITLLDELIGQRISGTSPVAAAMAATAAGPRPSPGTKAKPAAATPSLDIHGEIGFTYGWSDGGSFIGGDIVLTHTDPKERYSILVGYSQYEGKGVYPVYGLLPGYGPYSGAMPFSR